MNPSLDPDTRADLMIHEMTLDEKIQLVHGIGWGVLRAGAPVPPADNGGAGFVPGIPRLHLPDINLADSAVGVRMAALHGRYATLLPSVLGMSASWDPDAAFLYGSVIGRELRAQGYNMSIGGGMDLIREPRNGRNFEYSSEDPILAGTMVGQLARGVQSNHIMGDIKHYVLNDQETGRNFLDAVLDPRSLRETDLLAFQIAITLAHPAGGDVFLQPRERRLRLRERLCPQQGSETRLGIQGLRALRLGRHALDRKGRTGWSGHGSARRRRLLQRTA